MCVNVLTEDDSFEGEASFFGSDFLDLLFSKYLRVVLRNNDIWFRILLWTFHFNTAQSLGTFKLLESSWKIFEKHRT